MTKHHGGVILAGGKGTRLLPLTSKRPKPALTVGGKTPIERSIEALEKCGINDIAITTGYMWKEIENLMLPSNNISFYRETAPMGTLGMVFEILPFLSDDFFVISGDCVFDFSLLPMLEFHKSKNAAVTVAAVKSYSPTDYGTIVSENGLITEFREKPSWKQVISTKINAGIYIINRNVLEKHGKGCTDFASQLFPALLSSGETLACFDAEGYWCDMGTPESYRLCNMHFSQGDNSMGDYISISKDSDIKKSVIMNGVRVGSGTKIYSSVIGEGVSIGRNCLIEDAIIGPDSLICDNAVIEKNSVVNNDTIIGKGKTVTEKDLSLPLFSDSGIIKLSFDNIHKAGFIGNSLAGISSGREIIFYHDKSEGASDLCKKIFESAHASGGKVFSPKFAFSSLAAFGAKQRNAISVLVESSKNGYTIIIFDENGLSLSREEQIAFEKFRFTSTLPTKTALTDFDVFSEYARRMMDIPHSLSGFAPVFVSKNPPCTLCGEIIKKKGGNYSFVADKYAKSGDEFFIDEGGTDVFCITKEGEKLDKMRLFAITVTYFPVNYLPLPDYIPEIIKTLSTVSGGTFCLYGDSLEGRTKSNGFYSFDDGISIVLGVLFASSLSGLSISEMSGKLPPFAFAEKNYIFEGSKGKIYEALLQSSEKSPLSGARYTNEKGKTTIIPQYANAFKIFTESASSETAEELISEAEKNLFLLSQNDKQ